VAEFYERVGQHLRAWVAPAPKLREEKVEPATVGPDVLRQEAEQTALARSEPVASPSSNIVEEAVPRPSQDTAATRESELAAESAPPS